MNEKPGDTKKIEMRDRIARIELKGRANIARTAT